MRFFSDFGPLCVVAWETRDRERLLLVLHWQQAAALATVNGACSAGDGLAIIEKVVQHDISETANYQLIWWTDDVRGKRFGIGPTKAVDLVGDVADIRNGFLVARKVKSTIRYTRKPLSISPDVIFARN